MANRTAIFIDGAYLDHVVKQEFAGMRLDYDALSKQLAGNSDILRSYYYHCAPFQSNPPTEEERERYSIQRKFFESLERLPRYTVRLGRLARRKGSKGKGPRYEQKQVDILLGVDLVQLAAKRVIQEAILIAGDSDFIPAVTVAKAEGVLVTLFHGEKPHSDLWRESDERVRIDQDLINSVLRSRPQSD